jgi:hypothetical protein
MDVLLSTSNAATMANGPYVTVASPSSSIPLVGGEHTLAAPAVPVAWIHDTTMCLVAARGALHLLLGALFDGHSPSSYDGASIEESTR